MTGIETQALEDESNVEGEVDLKAELISSLEELRKSKKKNKQLRPQLSKYEEEQKSRNEESRQIIVDLKIQLQEAKKIEEGLELQLKERIQDSKSPEAEIILLRKKLDEQSVQAKFQLNSRILVDILNGQKSSSDKLDYDMTKGRSHNAPLPQYKMGIKGVTLLHSRAQLKRKKVRNMLLLFIIET